MKNPKKLKVLMISHVPIDAIYGAGTSLRGHLQSLGCQKQYCFGLILPKSIKHGNLSKLSDTEIIQTFPAVSVVSHHYMRSRMNYEAPKKGFPFLFRTSVNNLVNLLDREKMIQTINEFRPDLIHLNSLVLAPIALWLKRNKAVGDIPVLSHVRELLEPTLSQQAKQEIASVDGFICIDLAAQKRLVAVMDRMISGKDVSTLQNPFQSHITPPDQRLFQNVDLRSSTVFAIVGQVSAEKGAELVCEAFLRANLQNCVLLVVGQGNGAYGQRVKALCDHCPTKLKWLGQQPDLVARGFFNGVDTIVRGEATFCTGRTVYEALFSGASVLLPGTKFDLESDSNLLPFRDKVELYRPNDLDALIQAFQHLVANHPNKRTMTVRKSEPTSNFDSYAQSIQGFYESALKTKFMLCH